MLLLLFKTYIHQDIIAFIRGYTFILFNFNFIPIRDIPGVNVLSEWMDADQPNYVLSDLDLESRSTLTNSYTLIFIIGFATILYLVFKILLKNFEAGQGSPWYKRIWNWIRLNTIEFIFFTFYTRLFLLSYQHLLMASISELREFASSKVGYVFSDIVAIQVIVLCLMLLAISVGYFLKEFNTYNEKVKHFFQELHADQRITSWSKFYTPMQLGRKIIFVMILVGLKNWSKHFQFISFIVIQVAYIAALLLIRPFKLLYITVIDGINEVFYLILLIFFYICNTNSEWNDMKTLVMHLLMWNVIIIATIVLGKFRFIIFYQQ